ncbi:Uncharacterised protein [Acinetobacter baumannii]|nr:Uncharacterised protein [Acinetobacter baumannii]
MESVAADDKVAAEPARLVAMTVVNLGLRAVQRLQFNLLHLEKQMALRRQTRGDQVFQDFVLRINGDGALGQSGQIDAVLPATERQADPLMPRPFPPHPLPQSGLLEQIDGPLFEHPGANGRFHRLPAARFQHHRFHTLQVQQMGQHQAGRTGADDHNLCAHSMTPS